LSLNEVGDPLAGRALAVVQELDSVERSGVDPGGRKRHLRGGRVELLRGAQVGPVVAHASRYQGAGRDPASTGNRRRQRIAIDSLRECEAHLEVVERSL